jgi:sulfur carrier protein
MREFAPDPRARPRPMGDAVLVNGHPVAWHAGITVADLVADDEATVATALNGRFIARHARSGAPLAPGDALLVFTAIVGG